MNAPARHTAETVETVEPPSVKDRLWAVSMDVENTRDLADLADLAEQIAGEMHINLDAPQVVRDRNHLVALAVATVLMLNKVLDEVDAISKELKEKPDENHA